MVLGITTYDKIIQQYGAPYSESTSLTNDQTIETATYAYASSNGDPAYEGITPSRAISFSFSNNVLVSYQLLSSFMSDNTDFDEAKVHNIKKGESNRDKVIEIMGNPSGISIYPVVKGTDCKALSYFYFHSRGSSQYSKHLIVTCDKNGIVSDINLLISGNK